MSENFALVMNPELGRIWAAPLDNTCVIADQVAFDQFLNRKSAEFASVEGILITVELNWGKTEYSVLYGLDLVEKLRARGFRCPITLTSYLPENQLEFSQAIPDERFRYLAQDPSMRFIPLLELEKGSPHCLSDLFEDALDEFLSQELMHSLYNKWGYVRKLLHDFSSGLRCLDSTVLKQQLVSGFFEISALFPEWSDEIENLKTGILDLIQSGASRKSWSSPIHQKLEQLKSLLSLPVQPGQDLEDEFPEKGLSILIIDDEDKEIDLLEERLRMVNGLQGLLTCFRANNGAEARRILEGDRDNQIRVVVCDSRFYDANGKFAREQGYHIINEIDKMDRLTSFIALTGIEPDYLHQLQKNISCRAMPFTKHKVLKNDHIFTHFVRWILEFDRNLVELLSDQFNFKNPGYFKEYLRHKSAHDYSLAEKEIAEKAREIVMNVKMGKLPLSKGDYFISKYSSKILIKNPPQVNLENFRIKLLGRRIALGLYQVLVLNIAGTYEMPDHEKLGQIWVKIFNLLKYGDLEGNLPEKTQFADLINTNLRLWKSKDYSYLKGDNKIMTPEEIVWLKQMGACFSKISD
jgi:CheY-like chemotaxis protein